MRTLTILLTVGVVGCALGGGSGVATEIDLENPSYQLGDTLIALQMRNDNFEDALVFVELPEGQTVRLGWIPGEHTKAWLVPLELDGVVTFRIQLMRAGQQFGVGGQSRSVLECRSRMHFTPGQARRLLITEPVGQSTSFCPGANTGRF